MLKPVSDPDPIQQASTARVGFLLLPGFGLLSYAAALEPLRQANRLSGRALYSWSHLSLDGKSVIASSGTEIAVDHEVGVQHRFDIVIICAATGARYIDDAGLMRWLRRLAQTRRTLIIGLSGGAFPLARAGLLKGRRVTLHWEDAPAFAEAFVALDVSLRLFEFDRSRATCAGGVATIDLMHALIADAHGRGLADAVTERFLHGGVRDGATPQRLDLRARLGVGHPKLLRVLAQMEGQLDEAAQPAALAELAGLSVRQLERLFRQHVGSSIGAHSRALRLDRARQLLRGTSLSVLDVAVACGFVSPSHFSRAYREVYGQSPGRERVVPRHLDPVAEGRRTKAAMMSS